MRPRIYLLIQCDYINSKLFANHLDVPDHLFPHTSHLVANPELHAIGPGPLVYSALLHEPHQLVHLLKLLVSPYILHVLVLIVGLQKLDNTKEITVRVLLDKQAPVELVERAR